MNTEKMINETYKAEADLMNRKQQVFNTPAGEVTCFIHRHGSRTTANSWERIDFYLDNENGFNKVKRDELEKALIN